jgi:RNA polymerase sigma-70 factor (ECF subfamily)
MWTDQEIVDRVKADDTALYEIIMRRYNQRLYRVSHLDQFAGRAPFSAWLTRIAVNEALGRLRLRNRNPQLDDTDMMENFI